MKNITISNFFDTLSRKMISSLLTKDTINTLGFNSQSENVSSNQRFDHFFKNAFMFLLFVFSGFSTMVAQTTTTFPPQERCTSKDLELVSATLTGGDACNSCTDDEQLTRTLTLGINNKTGSTRTSFAFWGKLVITPADGGEDIITNISGCAGPIPPTGPLPASYSKDFGTIEYNCGDALKIIELYLAWTDASSKSDCPSINSAKINPKCGTLPSIQINSGVNGDLDPTPATCSGGGSIDLTPFGGTPFTAPAAPYTYSWSTLDGDIPDGQSDDQDLTGLVPGTYTVIITDSLGCTTTKQETITAPDALDPPTFCLVQPSSLCDATSETGSVIINGPCGEGYFYSIDDGDTWQPEPLFEGLAAGEVTGIRVKLGECISEAASCDDSDCDAEPCPAIGDFNKTINKIVPKEAATNEETPKVGFEAYPVPFKDQLTIKYNFDYTTDVKIEVFNSRGILVLTKNDTNAYLNKEIALDLKLNRGKEQMYVVKVTTNRGSTTKKVISSK